MCSRDLLEWTVRERVSTLPQIRFLQKTDVTGLLPTPNGKEVVTVEDRFHDIEYDSIKLFRINQNTKPAA